MNAARTRLFPASERNLLFILALIISLHVFWRHVTLVVQVLSDTELALYRGGDFPPCTQQASSFTCKIISDTCTPGPPPGASCMGNCTDTSCDGLASVTKCGGCFGNQGAKDVSECSYRRTNCGRLVHQFGQCQPELFFGEWVCRCQYFPDLHQECFEDDLFLYTPCLSVPCFGWYRPEKPSIEWTNTKRALLAHLF